MNAQPNVGNLVESDTTGWQKKLVECGELAQEPAYSRQTPQLSGPFFQGEKAAMSAALGDECESRPATVQDWFCCIVVRIMITVDDLFWGFEQSQTGGSW